MILSKYFETIRHLKRQQIYFRFYYFFRKLFSLNKFKKTFRRDSKAEVILNRVIDSRLSYKDFTFSFLNLYEKFSSKIDWDYLNFGRLWCYNLNSFQFLNQEAMGTEEGVRLISDFVDQLPNIKTGLEPYPTSLRIRNWIKFLSTHNIKDKRIDDSLFRQSHLLMNNIEYHLMGNHLLENGISLLFAAVYFDDDELSAKAGQVISEQLKEQILPDGGHFELSPMYHQIILEGLLDCINVLKNNRSSLGNLLPLIITKTSIMLGWLRQMIFTNRNIPLVNDSAGGIAPAADELFSYSKKLDVIETVVPLRESGYRKINCGKWELLVDVGNIGPDYIPGHAHSDTFSFVLYVNSKPFIVDTGVSTYDANDARLSQRKTSAHNTVQVDNLDQSEVWSSFRVARRAYVKDLVEKGNSISGTHTGYERIGARHQREFVFNDDEILIKDKVLSGKKHDCRAFFHFHPNVNIEREGDSFLANGVKIIFSNSLKVTVSSYNFAPEFNILISAKMLEVSFNAFLETVLKTVPCNDENTFYIR